MAGCASRKRRRRPVKVVLARVPTTGCVMRANDVRSTEILRHGAYVCVKVPERARRTVASAAVPALAERLGLRNEFEPGDDHPPEAIAFLRRVGGTPADIADDDLLHT